MVVMSHDGHVPAMCGTDLRYAATRRRERGASRLGASCRMLLPGMSGTMPSRRPQPGTNSALWPYAPATPCPAGSSFLGGLSAVGRQVRRAGERGREGEKAVVARGAGRCRWRLYSMQGRKVVRCGWVFAVGGLAVRTLWFARNGSRDSGLQMPCQHP
eukprot:3870489-Rhodomonas_salina.1